MSRTRHQLSADEKFHLQNYQAKLETLRDLVRGVVKGYHPAAYLTGRAGIGKTYTVRDEVRKSGKVYAYRNARLTPTGLFELFDRYADDVIVLDDVASLFKDKAALQVLQGALDSEPPRRVTRTIHGRDEVVTVNGGLIAISNVPLEDDPIALSIQSRVVPHEFDATNDEIAALMKHLVLKRRKGLHGLTQGECLQVVDFLIAEAKRHALWLDLRHLAKSCGFFRQWRDGQATNDWRDLIRLTIRQPLKNGPLSKREEIDQQRDRVRRLMALYPNNVHRQIRESGLSQSTFYVRRKEIQSEEQRARRREPS